jgi:hypothetical protein
MKDEGETSVGVRGAIPWTWLVHTGTGPVQAVQNVQSLRSVQCLAVVQTFQLQKFNDRDLKGNLHVLIILKTSKEGNNADKR